MREESAGHEGGAHNNGISTTSTRQPAQDQESFDHGLGNLDFTGLCRRRGGFC
jgi:hypothetical protein